ncbi:MAG TPA: hypothetical protein VGN12_09725 [Pirellulales bacterium]|jgi:hypothetical protein
MRQVEQRQGMWPFCHVAVTFRGADHLAGGAIQSAQPLQLSLVAGFRIAVILADDR